MDNFIKKFDNIISLGCNCAPKKFIDQYKKQEFLFFDYVGSSMWSINELINNNFNDIFNINDYQEVELNQNFKCVINKKFYIRFLHDLEKNINNFSFFSEKYNRRKLRFLKLLNESKNILFIRLEDCIIKKYSDIYKDKYPYDEFYYMNQFIHIIKNKFPKLNFHVLYFNSQFNKIVDNIIFIKINILDINWNNCNEIFNNAINDNISFFLPK